MPPKDPVSKDTEHSQILDRIYEIALEPALLDDFINLWADGDWAAHFANGDPKSVGTFDAVFKAHLDRAEAFLQLGDTSQPNRADPLEPYKKVAAFCVNASLTVEEVNPGAQSAFGISTGDALSSLNLPDEFQAALASAVQDVLRRPESTERLIKSENETKQGALLFRVIPVRASRDMPSLALVVSTHVHWRESIGDILSNAFHLTQAEQNVVRKLTEGQDVKSIATARGTAVGTVREQVKSIISKMNVRSQADVVRFALILNDFSDTAKTDDSTKTPSQPVLSDDWLDTQVWKPFSTITLPDGRVMAYHEMGPSNGHPVLYSHMGSAMVRWTKPMIKLAFQHNLHVICPIRAGYGDSDKLDVHADVLDTINNDTVFLLKSLGISKIPYAVQGSDFPFAADLVAKYPDLITEVIGIGARPCLPGGESVEGWGRWQQFFVWTARHNPKLVHFASKAVMMMSKRIGSKAMLMQICKDSPADLALLELDDVKIVLIANLDLMAGPSSHAARAFAMEYIAFHQDWSGLMKNMRQIPIHIYTAEQDPTINLSELEKLRPAYPWITFEVVPNAGLALMYQAPTLLIPALAEAAKRAAIRAKPDLEQHKTTAVFP
ncbi:MAG: LuxR C-terminal-related transcriptional regulator [Paracoccaceae bacterium]